jgi:hypothetical protein
MDNLRYSQLAALLFTVRFALTVIQFPFPFRPEAANSEREGGGGREEGKNRKVTAR